MKHNFWNAILGWLRPNYDKQTFESATAVLQIKRLFCRCKKLIFSANKNRFTSSTVWANTFRTVKLSSYVSFFIKKLYKFLTHQFFCKIKVVFSLNRGYAVGPLCRHVKIWPSQNLRFNSSILVTSRSFQQFGLTMLSKLLLHTYFLRQNYVVVCVQKINQFIRFLLQ